MKATDAGGEIMARFSKVEFVGVPDSVRAERCDELARVLTDQLKGVVKFHERVASLVTELRAAGHDLSSFDESDDMEVWGPNYVHPSGPGIVVTFRPDDVSVEWAPT